MLAVERREDCTSFWIERLGFAMTNQVPGDEAALVFAILERGDIEVKEPDGNVVGFSQMR